MRSVLFLLVFCLAVVSCGSDTEETVNAGSLNVTAFPFEFKADHIAYMSCTHIPDPRAFFRFKLGGYNLGAGLKLSKDFLNDTTNLQNRFHRRKRALQNTNMTQTTLELTVRNGYNLNNVFLFEDGELEHHSNSDRYFSTNTVQFQSSSLLNPLLRLAEESTSKYLRYLDGERGDNKLSTRRYFEGQLRLPRSVNSGLSKERQEFSHVFTSTESTISQRVLSFGFTHEASFRLRYNSRGSVFRLSFGRPAHASSLRDNRLLTHIVEEKASGPENDDRRAASGTWTCDAYTIMRDADRLMCAEEENVPNTPVAQAMEKLLGQTGYWHLNHTQKCVVPKDLRLDVTAQAQRNNLNICYHETGSALSAGAEAVPDCNANPELCDSVAIQNRGVSYTESCASNDKTRPYCPHYVSVCWKTN